MKKLMEEPMVRFLAVGFFLYLTWLGLYEYWIHPKTEIDRVVVADALDRSESILVWIGYSVQRVGDKVIKIQGTPGLFIGDSCDGISLFALYSIFIFAFPGRWLSKIIFIPLGIVLIHLLNVLRIVTLALIETQSYAWTQFNHTYTFTIAMYTIIFFVWVFWINKFSPSP